MLEISFFEDKLHASLNQSGKPDLRADFDFLSDALAVVVRLLVCVKLDLAEPAIRWIVISQHIERKLTGAKPLIANFRSLGFVLLADFVLKALAAQVLVESLEAFHHLTSSHLNRPFELFLHCPIPRSAP